MIEKGTNYSFLLKAEKPFNFQKIKGVSDQFIVSLSQDQQDVLFKELTSNVLMLNSEPLMAAYLHFLGEAQEARLRRAYSYFSKSFFNKDIEIIDYGCGLGIAEIVYHDFMQTRALRQKIRRITLIDPSEIAVKRAGLHTQLVFPDTVIHVVCKELKELNTEDILSGTEIIKLHLLMDIPSLSAETINHLSNVIKTNIKGLNYFICISPYYKESANLLEHLDTFIEIMNPDQKFRYSEDMDINQLVPGKPWTCSLRIFMKNEIKDGEFVIEKDVKYWITNNSIKYNEEKTILIQCPSSIKGEYVLPNTISAIEPKAFRGCENLSMIIADNSSFITVDGVLYSYDMSRLIKYPQAKTGKRFEVSKSVQIIDPYAFSGCTLLEEIILPDLLTTLKYGAFECCTQLKSIIIPPSVVRIEGNAFALCASLWMVDFNPTCCELMENIETSGGISSYRALVFEGCISLTNIRVGETVTRIPDFAFSFCEYVSSIVLPDSVTYVGCNSFSYCKQLETIVLTKSVKTIGKDAFFWCKNLHSIIVPAGTLLYFKKMATLRGFIFCIKEDRCNKKVKLNVYPHERKVNELSEQDENGFCKCDDDIYDLLELANQGDMKVQNKLGFLYETGEKVKQNSYEAVKWYRMAAEQGYAKAQFNLANQYALGRGVEKNDSEAKEWYFKAANQGIIDAMNNLGAMYTTGRGVEKNEAKAIEWYRRAAEKGDKTAISNLHKRGFEV